VSLGEGAHLRANGIRQHYLHFPGRGPTVLVIPGIISPAILWQHMGAWLAPDFDCMVLDVRGRGLSEAGAHLDYGVDACADDVIGFARTIGLRDAVLLGHSMGARIALRAAVRSPGLFSQLLLLDPPTSGPGRRPYPVPKARTLGLLQAAQRGEALEAMQRSGAKPWPEAMQRLRAEWLCSCDERAVHVAYDDFHGQDMFADLRDTIEPVGLICAGEGGVVSEDDLAQMHTLRPDLRSTRLPGVGHQMQAEGFEPLCVALAAMLDRPRLSSTDSRMGDAD
jgi:N-formylmaleamate deformylase